MRISKRNSKKPNAAADPGGFLLRRLTLQQIHDMASGYSAVINVQVSGLKDVQLLENRIAQINKLTKSIRPVPSIFDVQKGTSDQALKINKTKRELTELVKKYADGNTTAAKFSSTIAGVNNQLNNFNALAANARVGSDQFTNALKAAANASANLFKKELDRLETLRTLYERQPGAGQQDVRAYGPSQLVKDLLKQQTQIPQSVAALEAYQSELVSVQRLVGLTSQEFEELAVAIRKVDVQLGKVEFGPQPAMGFQSPQTTTGRGRGPNSAGRLANVALGAGFPLLFGGGPGAVLGGAAGGLIPGPGAFAAQIAFSAIGQQIDKFVAEVTKVGVALTSTTGTFELMKEKSLFSSEAVKNLAYELEEQGKVQELATLLTTDLAKQIGSAGVKALQNAGDETKEFTRLVNLLFTQLSSFVAGPLASFLATINNALRGLAGNIQFRAVESSLTGAQAAKFAQIKAEELGTRTENIRGSKTRTVTGPMTVEAQANILKRAEQAGILPSIPGRVTSEDIRSITAPRAPKPKRDTAGERAAREAEREATRVAEALRTRQLNTREIEIQLDFSQKIFSAEQAKDKLLVTRLKGQQDLAELGIETAKLLEDEKNSSVQLAIAKEQQSKADLLRLTTAQELKTIEADLAEKASDYLRDLEYQLELNNAVSREAQTEIEIRKELEKLRKDGITDEEKLLAIAQAKRALGQPTELRDFIRSATDELNNLQVVAVNVSQGIGSAIGNSLSNGINGLIEGTTTAKQIFADFLKSVGDILIQEGTRMIAMYVAIGIAKIFAGLGGGGGGAEPRTDAGNAAFMQRTAGLDLAGSAYNPSAPIPGFASGGYVTGPTRAVVGEGGESEYIIPASKMAGAMARYSAGARGSNVIPDSSAPSAGGPGGSNTFTLETVVINNVEYATVEQVRELSARAARDGAEGGYTRSMSALRNSRSQRSRIGLR